MWIFTWNWNLLFFLYYWMWSLACLCLIWIISQNIFGFFTLSALTYILAFWVTNAIDLSSLLLHQMKSTGHFLFILVFNLMTFQNILFLNTSGRWDRSGILIFFTPITRFSQKPLHICIFVFASSTIIQAGYFVIFFVITSLNNLINFLTFIPKAASLCYVFFNNSKLLHFWYLNPCNCKYFLFVL
jgi:hypothetical protein